MGHHQNTKLVLVVGGAGFIGSHTVDLLLSEGYRVRVLDNFSTGKRHNLPETHERLEILAGDMSDQAILRRICVDITHVLHLAAQVSVVDSLENPVFSCQQNILSFVAVLDAARMHNARFVYASSAAIYGNQNTLPLQEEDPALPISPYGLEKYSNELYADLYGRIYGLSHLGLRYFNVYGPRQDPKSPYSGVISRFVDQVAAGKPLTVRGDGKQFRDFIHVRDVARANVAALRGNTLGVLNVARGEATSIIELAKLIEKISGSVSGVHWVPDIPGDIKRSLADSTRMRQFLCSPQWPLAEGIRELLGQ